MNPIESIVRKHLEAMHDQLAEVILEDFDKDWFERNWADGKDFAADVLSQVGDGMMTSAEYADWFEDHRTRGPL